eukprot:3314719-Prymnesium_polylepis.2
MRTRCQPVLALGSGLARLRQAPDSLIRRFYTRAINGTRQLPLPPPNRVARVRWLRLARRLQPQRRMLRRPLDDVDVAGPHVLEAQVAVPPLGLRQPDPRWLGLAPPPLDAARPRRVAARPIRPAALGSVGGVGGVVGVVVRSIGFDPRVEQGRQSVVAEVSDEPAQLGPQPRWE